MSRGSEGLMRSTTRKSEAQESALTSELIEGGSDLVGAVAGAAVGLVGGPAGAFGGATAGVLVARAVRHVGAEVKQRLLSPRQEARIGGVLALATVTIDAALRSGRRPRDDGFFEPRGTERPAAEEVLEGVLLKARDTYEEKKVPLLANLYASVALVDGISPAMANHLVALAERLTYRQLVVMAVISDDSQKSLLRDGSYRNDNNAIAALGMDGQSLLIEIYDMSQQGLIGDSKGAAWISVPDVDPRAMRLQASGSVLAQAMMLADAIPDRDREDARRMLAIPSQESNRP